MHASAPLHTMNGTDKYFPSFSIFKLYFLEIYPLGLSKGFSTGSSELVFVLGTAANVGERLKEREKGLGH